MKKALPTLFALCMVIAMSIPCTAATPSPETDPDAGNLADNGVKLAKFTVNDSEDPAIPAKNGDILNFRVDICNQEGGTWTNTIVKAQTKATSNGASVTVSLTADGMFSDLSQTFAVNTDAFTLLFLPDAVEFDGNTVTGNLKNGINIGTVERFTNDDDGNPVIRSVAWSVRVDAVSPIENIASDELQVARITVNGSEDGAVNAQKGDLLNFRIDLCNTEGIGVWTDTTVKATISGMNVTASVSAGNMVAGKVRTNSQTFAVNVSGEGAYLVQEGPVKVNGNAEPGDLGNGINLGTINEVRLDSDGNPVINRITWDMRVTEDSPQVQINNVNNNVNTNNNNLGIYIAIGGSIGGGGIAVYFIWRHSRRKKTAEPKPTEESPPKGGDT